MFVLKKIIKTAVTIPGIFIVVLWVWSFINWKKNRAWAFKFFSGLCIYVISISLTANVFLGAVEEHAVCQGGSGADCIVLLGGGIIEGVNDISGKHIPHPEVTARLVDAVRLHKKYSLPIIMTGGSHGSSVSEAEVVERFLTDLGVDEKHIILEVKSRDTVENAELVKKLMARHGFSRAVLVTSAYHLRRAAYIFQKTGIDVIPHSAAALAENKEESFFIDFLPGIGDFRKTAIALHETVGYVFYMLKYELFE